MPGGFGGGGGCLPVFLFLIVGAGIFFSWVALLVRSAVGALSKGRFRKLWVGVFALCLLALMVAVVWWSTRVWSP